MNFPRPSLPDLAPTYPSQPYSQHFEYQNVPAAQQSFGPYRVDQTSVTSSTWQAQSFCGPAASTQHHVQQPFGSRVPCSGDEPVATGFLGNSQLTSTISTALAPPIHPQERTRKRKAATLRAADWEPYKKRILDLHNVQNLPLSKVKQVMEEEYGFHAEYATTFHQVIVSLQHGTNTEVFAGPGSTNFASLSGTKTRTSSFRRCKQSCESIRRGSSSSLTSADWYSRCEATK
jgi:hypothetical protein